MSYSTNPYCTLTQVKSALDLQATTSDSILNDLITQAQSMLDAEIGYSFQSDGTVAAPASRVYDGNGKSSLLIPEGCLSLVQVLENTTASTSAPTDTTSDCYLQYPYKLCHLLNTFTAGVQNITVKGVFGQPSIPPEITRACVRLVVHWFKMRDTNYADMMVEQGNVRVHYHKEIPPDVQQIIDRKRTKISFAR